MRYFVIISYLFLFDFCFSQTNNNIENSNKGRLYLYWGWNIDWYSKSDINFWGNDYNFTIKKAIANDKPSPFSFSTYFNPQKATIPQYNFRIGYYFKNNWDVSFGIDHMKYVVQQNQIVKINGYIKNSNTIFDNSYSNQNIKLTEDFLQFEHTDGLNYLNTEIRHSNKLISIKKINISLIEGLGVGLLYPKTNAKLLGKARHDDFHVSGYGIDGVIGVNINFLNWFFFQSELKGGFINMPDIRTTYYTEDKARQNFFFSQFNFVFGGIINIKSNKK
ncbi:MAG TPA: hypothetical protein PK995_02895 [Bacteroidia bacterium]|nr:hypothetical protein [Bacteroidia bacterium]